MYGRFYFVLPSCIGEGTYPDTGYIVGGDVGTLDGHHLALARHQVEEVVGEVGPLGGYFDEYILGQTVGREGEGDALGRCFDGFCQVRPG